MAGHPGGMHGLYCVPRPGEPEPAVDLVVRAQDGGSWEVSIPTEDFTFNTDHVDGPHVPGTGHGHFYVDGLKLQRVFRDQLTLNALPPGQRILRITLNSNDHRTYLVGGVPVSATRLITVN